MKIGVLEAKNQFSALADRAVAGEEIIVTKRGEPYVKIVPVKRKHDPEALRARIDSIRSRLKSEGVTLGADEIRALRDEGRR
ncbi:MAG: type II toxin-antitoxin system Phd/YefM family antitoxin [Phreatobacter sp.]